MNTGDQSLIKNLNRRIILEKIAEKKSISRAQLSKLTGLNKATVTARIGELLNEGIVVETKFDKSTGGRKPILLSINKDAGYAMGIELDVDHIQYVVTDLWGRIVKRYLEKVNTKSFELTREILMRRIQNLIEEVPRSRYGVIGIGIGIHGIVDKTGRIVFATHSNWRDVDLKDYLHNAFGIPVFIDNNTNLCAIAEKTFFVDDPNILCLTISSGIGMGIVINNVIYKGINGFAGEIGHMIIKENGRECSCGNRGCWERYASEKAFLNDLAKLKNIEECSMEQVRVWIDQKDDTTLDCLDRLAEDLCIGINNVINIFNPETIILNSQLISLYPNIIDYIKGNLSSSMNDYKRILYSKLGGDACALGASAVAIRSFLDVSDLKLLKEY